MTRAKLMWTREFVESVRDAHDCPKRCVGEKPEDTHDDITECWNCYAEWLLQTVWPKRRAA